MKDDLVDVGPKARKGAHIPQPGHAGLKTNQVQARYCVATTMLLMIVFVASTSVGFEVEAPEILDGALMQRSPVDIAAAVSDCLETLAYQGQTLEDDALDLAFGDCVRSAMVKFDHLSEMSEDELAPTASGDNNRGLDCALPKWGCRTTTRCPKPWPPQVLCRIDECGTGTCPSCPNLWGNILIKSWCTYKCTRDGKVVGSAFELNAHFKYLGPICFSK